MTRINHPLLFPLGESPGSFHFSFPTYRPASSSGESTVWLYFLAGSSTWDVSYAEPLVPYKSAEATHFACFRSCLRSSRCSRRAGGLALLGVDPEPPGRFCFCVFSPPVFGCLWFCCLCFRLPPKKENPVFACRFFAFKAFIFWFLGGTLQSNSQDWRLDILGCRVPFVEYPKVDLNPGVSLLH